MEEPAASAARPLSIKELADAAEDYKWNTGIALKYWIRAATALLSEARISAEEGHIDNAYMLYVRHCNLVLNDLSKHPEAKVPENKNAIRKLARAIPNVMEELQTIKPVIEANHAEWLKINAAQVEARPRSRAAQTTRNSVRASLVPPAAKVLDAGEHSDLAVELAQQALDRRATRRAARRGTITEKEEHERRTGGVWEDWDAKNSRGDQTRFTADQDLQLQMAATRRMLDRQDHESTNSHRYDEYDPAPTPARPPHYNYPSISHSVGASYRTDPRPISAAVDLQRPPRPAKIRDAPAIPSFDRDVPPPVPGKVRYPTDETTSLGLAPWDRDEAPQRPPKQPLKPVQKQQTVTFKASAYLEDGSPLRPVFLPDKLRSTFLSVAADNTRRGVEMCGILCGTKVNGALFVSVLLIPEQTCTSDTCETENEWAISEFCEENTLEVFGWIHTHPTQTCFMSSRDLHTQAGYQTFLPESIAIVCSPQHEPSYGIFRLTQPPGLPHIMQCTQSATFHQHSIDNIYTNAVHPPGHVYETDRLDFAVEDLRPGFGKK